ncbi:tetratricopeptide repeat protein [Massilia sp. PAMC28688]|uniref:YfgM family protein n=1 Tax=Massilia sp. PAMC28688 TaxID=2861283 RepID=UPI001C63653D|nr:tetratricopeptide repeat protein [Massilia sp. PAMC28688]QYF92311.1 tetratricopeptide repeat protein [Massilia sp. PAMC28688]
MAYDHEEQEQLATLQDFWKKWGNLIMTVLILVFGAYAAYNYYNYYQRKQAVEASVLYDQLQASLATKDNAKVQRMAADVQSKYKSSAYAQMAALAAAKSAFDINDLKTAKAQLQWVIDNGNDEYKSLARIRLSGVLLDEKAYDAAMQQLGTGILPQFAGAVSDRKGDILVAQNKIAEARAAYLAALNAMDDKNPGRQLVQLKLEAIGGTAPAPKAGAAAAAAA